MIKKLMLQIESHEFAALLNIASSFKVFWRAVYKEQATKELIEQLQDYPENIWLVFKRAVDLAQNEIDLEYENPWDTALAVYLGALSMVNLEMAQTAAGFVIQAENGWWATKFANSLLQPEKAPSAATFEKYKMKFESAKPKSTSQEKPEIKFTEKQIDPSKERKIVKQSAALTWAIETTNAKKNLSGLCR